MKETNNYMLMKPIDQWVMIVPIERWRDDGDDREPARLWNCVAFDWQERDGNWKERRQVTPAKVIIALKA